MNEMGRTNQPKPARMSPDGYPGYMSRDYLGYFK
jgi:hypothetical protein